jgi:hypothetical protein
MSILELFCSVDDFWLQFAPKCHSELLSAGQRQRVRASQMHPSEMMTILILFQQSHYRTFKAYYTEYVQRHLRSEFPKQMSYQRFVELMSTLLVPLVAYLHTQLGRCTGISFIDSTKLAVCHNARIHQRTASLRGELLAARPQPAGSTASSCTWSSMMRATCWPSA